MKLQSKYLIICLLFTQFLGAQTLADFKYLNYPYTNEFYIGVAVSRTTISNPDAPFPSRHKLQAFSGTVELKSTSFAKGGMRYYGQHKLLPDMLVLTKQAINVDPNVIYRNESSYLANGILGWHSFTWNLHDPKKYSVALGFNLNDYFFGSTYHTDTTPNSWVSPEPQGYYFAAGPTLQANYMLGKYFMAEMMASYSLSYWRAVSLTYATVNDKYPKPHFAQLHFELFSTWGLFAGIDYNFIINRGDIPNNTQRFDLSVGFRFMTDSDPD